jgi:hypothetical protein
MDPTDLYGDSYSRKMRLRDFLEEAEHDRLATEAAKASPTKDGGLSAPVSDILSRGLPAVMDAVQAFWARALLAASRAVQGQ